MTNKPFFLLKTKEEFLLAEKNGQLEIVPEARNVLMNSDYSQEALFGAKITKFSPGKVVEVKLVDSPEVFQELTF